VGRVITWKPPSQTALPRSCVDGIDPRYRPRRRHRHERGRHHTRHTAVPDGLGGRDRWVLHDLLASRWAQSPIGAHVVCIFGKEKLYTRRSLGCGEVLHM
jgi:hypothetical protein